MTMPRPDTGPPPPMGGPAGRLPMDSAPRVNRADAEPSTMLRLISGVMLAVVRPVPGEIVETIKDVMVSADPWITVVVRDRHGALARLVNVHHIEMIESPDLPVGFGPGWKAAEPALDEPRHAAGEG